MSGLGSESVIRSTTMKKKTRKNKPKRKIGVLKRKRRNKSKMTLENNPKADSTLRRSRHRFGTTSKRCLSRWAAN